MRTTSTKTFTAVGVQSEVLLARNGDTITYAESGDNTASEFTIESSTTGGATWDTAASGLSGDSGTIEVVTGYTNAAGVRYRARCTVFDAGDTDVVLLLTHDSNDNVKFIDGTAHTVTAEDADKILYTLSGDATTITVPDSATEQLPIDFQCTVVQGGAGAVTIAKTGSDVLRSPGDLVSVSAQYAAVTLVRISRTETLLVGSLA